MRTTEHDFPGPPEPIQSFATVSDRLFSSPRTSQDTCDPGRRHGVGGQFFHRCVGLHCVLPFDKFLFLELDVPKMGHVSVDVPPSRKTNRSDWCCPRPLPFPCLTPVGTRGVAMDYG